MGYRLKLIRYIYLKNTVKPKDTPWLLAFEAMNLTGNKQKYSVIKSSNMM